MKVLCNFCHIGFMLQIRKFGFESEIIFKCNFCGYEKGSFW